MYVRMYYVCMCVYVCMNVCMYLCMYIYIYTHTRTHTHIVSLLARLYKSKHARCSKQSILVDQ